MSLIKTILVDDDYLVLKDLRSMIDWKALGFSIEGTASTGKAALRLASDCKPSLVITDISMPVMDGFDFTETLRHAHPDVYIIFITSYADFDYAKRAIGLGVQDYILKNEITPEVLTRKMCTVRERIRHTEKNTQLNLRSELALYFKNIRTGLPDRLTDQPMFFLVFSRQLPFEKLNAHYSRTEHAGQLLYDSLSDRIFQKYPSSLLFAIDHMVIAGLLPSEAGSLSFPSSVQRITRCFTEELTNKDDGKLLCFFLPKVIPLSRFRESFRSFAPQIRFYCLFPGDRFVFPMDNNASFVPENLPFNYGTLTDVLTQSGSFFDALQEYTARLSENRDAESFLMLFHNLSLQLEELTEGFISMSKPFLFHDKEDFCACFQDLIRKWQNTKKVNQIPSCSPVVEKAIQFIRKNYGDHLLTINVIADTLQISPSRLSVLFKKESGQTVNEYLTGVRIRQSIYLLENTNMRIYEVAEHVGYKSSQYFSQAFQQKTGKKPIDLRRRSGK